MVNTLTVDPSVQESLTALPGLTEVRDANGQVIGYYSPTGASSVGNSSPEMYAEAAANLDPAEMTRRKQSGETGRTTAEVLAHLQSLEK